MNNTEELWLEGGGVRIVYTDEYVEQLEKQRDELLAAAKIILSDAPLDQGIRALAAAVRKCKTETNDERR